jgi:3-hydroxyisobutyrate dehydrogenase-like beta-hydroxyacid dehydrogenase
MSAAGAAPSAADSAEVRIALIGYGEVGGILGRALAALDSHSSQTATRAALRTFDRLFDDPACADGIRQRAVADGVEPAASAGDAVAGADLILSAVTADQTMAATKSVLSALKSGAFYVDVNSASPRTKADCAALVNARGGRYVEMAVMTSVPPYGIRVPMLSGGPHAAAAAPLLASLGFQVEPASEQYGVASAIKMCRSVIIKGMEALVIESFTSARRYGVERQVLASLAETYPGIDWEQSGDYFFQRVIQHGQRRADEMREAAATVREAGLEPLLAAATAERQAFVAALARAGAFAAAAGAKTPWRERADAILKRAT